MITVLKAPSFDAPSYFAAKAEGELDLLMASLALDTTGLIMIGENYKESSYAPHARAAEIILDEEADHEIFASRHLGDAVERFGVKSVSTALRRMASARGKFLRPARHRLHLRLHPLRPEDPATTKNSPSCTSR